MPSEGQPPVRVFVSSTFHDNRQRRQIVEDAILRADLVPVGMERFTASSRPTVEECLRLVRESDWFVGVIAHRYGWIPEESERSITELEYDAAKERGLPRLMFVINDEENVNLQRDFDEEPNRWDKQNKLKAFKAKIRADQMPAVFKDENLGAQLLQALYDERKRDTTRDSERVRMAVERGLQVLVEHLSVDDEEMDNALAEGRLDEIEADLRKGVETLAELASATGTDRRVLVELSQRRFQLARVLSDQQRRKEAGSVLAEVDAELLTPLLRSRLVRCWAAIDDPKRARIELDRIPQDARPADLEITEARVAIAEGVLPRSLPDDAGVLVAAAWLHLQHGQLSEAASLALQALSKGTKSPLSEIGPFVVLARALHGSVWRSSWVEVPLGQALVAEVIDVLDRLRMQHHSSWQKLGVGQPNSRGLTETLNTAVWIYQEAIEEIDPWPGFPRPDDARLLRAIEQAKRGELEAGLREFEKDETHPWLTRLRRTQLLMVAGRVDEARVESGELAERYPHHAPVERLAASVLMDASQYERALEHARRAYTQVPAGGYRLLLASCLMDSGAIDEAWQLVEPKWRTAGPRMLELSARLADRVRATEAPKIWEQLVKLQEQDVHARLRLAQALFRQNERDHAAEQAWSAFEMWRQSAEPSHEFGPGGLGLIARLQLRPPPILREAKKRIALLIDTLREWFPDSTEAEQLRLTLAHVIDKDTVIDVGRLVEAGLAMAIPVGEIPRWMQELNSRETAYWRIYNDAGITVTGLARAREESVPSLFERMWNDEQRHFCTFRSFRNSGDLVSEKIELLLGSTELLVLAKLELLDSLEKFARDSDMRLLVARSEVDLLEGGLLALPPDGLPSARLVLDWLQSDRVQVLDWSALHAGESFSVPELPPLTMKGDESEAFLRAPLRERIQQVGAFHAKPMVRSILSVDLFATSGIGNVVVGAAYAWPSDEHYWKLIRYLRQGAFMSIPELVRMMARAGVLQEDRRRSVAFELARQGFTDALDAEDLIALFRAAPSSRKRVFNGLEALNRRGDLSSAAVGKISVAGLYANAIVLASLGRGRDDDTKRISLVFPFEDTHLGRLPDDERSMLLSTLLGRLERLDEPDGDTLDTALLFVSLAVSDRFPEAFSPTPRDSSTSDLDESSPIGFLWAALADWAGDDGFRRAALDRAVCESLISLDRLSLNSGPGNKGPKVAPLLLSRSMERNERSLSAVKECIAILSANWEERLLRYSGIRFDIRGLDANGGIANPFVQVVEVLWEKILCDAAMSVDLSSPYGDGRSIVYDHQNDGLPVPHRLELPVDAVVLRATGERLIEGIQHLIVTQGSLDGRTYVLLNKLAASPDDPMRRREYARYSANAPWRRVRDDPAYLLRWIHKVDYGGDAPACLNSICQMLHEPVEVIEQDSLSETLHARREHDWNYPNKRVESLLVNLASTMPGAHGVYPLPDFSDQEDLAVVVEEAIERLEHPDDHAAGELVIDIHLLSVAAARLPAGIKLRRGVVVLGTLLPELFVRVIESTQLPRRGLGLHETSVLRICALVIQQAFRTRPGHGHRDYLWLTYRLHSWVTRQLDFSELEIREQGLARLAKAAGELGHPGHTLAEPQLFDPFMFEAYGFEYRKVVLLSALVLGTSSARQQEGADPTLTFTSPAMESLMLSLAEQAKDTLPEHPESWIDWPFPTAVPDLAAYWLLVNVPPRLFSSDPDHIIRRINRWPDELGTMDRGYRDLIEMMTRGLVFSIDSLEDGVIAAFRARLLSLSDDTVGRRVKWMGLSSLFARGASELESLVRDLNREHLGTEQASVHLGDFLSGIIGMSEDGLLPEVDELLAQAVDQPVQRRELIFALARVVIRAKQPGRAEVAHHALRSLAERPEFCDDRGLRAILDHLEAQTTS